MCASSGHPNGADAAEWNPRPFRVKVHHDDDHYWLAIPRAIGPRDAASQAREHGREQGIALEIGRIEEVPQQFDRAVGEATEAA